VARLDRRSICDIGERVLVEHADIDPGADPPSRRTGAPAIEKVSVVSNARSSTSCAASAPASELLISAVSIRLGVFIEHVDRYRAAMPTSSAAGAGGDVIRFSLDVAVSATPRAALVVRLPSTSCAWHLRVPTLPAPSPAVVVDVGRESST